MKTNKQNPLDNAKVGDGATYRVYTDSHAGTIIARTATTITWQRDHATLLNGPESGEPDALIFTPGGFAAHVEGVQRYSYERDPEGMIQVFRRRANGRWMAPGASKNQIGSELHAGRHSHHDYNF